MELRDSRRLTGPNILWDRPGAVIDVALPDRQATSVTEAWQRHARAVLDAVGWPTEQCASRTFEGGISLAISAPLDALYAATEVNEWAWAAAVAELEGEPIPRVDRAALRLKQVIAAEVNPPLLALEQEAKNQGVAFLADDDAVSVGMGAGSETWPVDGIPDPRSVDWKQRHDIPVALITGTNGKTTTVRLLAAMEVAANRVPGYTSTDWLAVGDDILDRDDWSGPGGARRVLRDTRADSALLETARGGMLRRGLGMPRADVALVTNIAADHLGEWGVMNLRMLAETKFVVKQAADLLVLNADDPEVVDQARECAQPIVWFSLAPNNPLLLSHIESGSEVLTLDDGELIHLGPDGRTSYGKVADMPLTMAGAARYNIYNALGAIGVARALGIDNSIIRRVLRSFTSDAASNPGRLNRFEVNDATVIVDFAHNPHGVKAVFSAASALPASRRLALLGQAGDRDLESTRETCRLFAEADFERVLIKEMEPALRGRALGEVPAELEAMLLEFGYPPDRIGHAPSEIAAVEDALAWAEPGDLLLLFSHVERDRVLARCGA